MLALNQPALNTMLAANFRHQKFTLNVPTSVCWTAGQASSFSPTDFARAKRNKQIVTEFLKLCRQEMVKTKLVHAELLPTLTSSGKEVWAERQLCPTKSDHGRAALPRRPIQAHAFA